MCDGQHRKKLIYYITPTTGNFRFIYLLLQRNQIVNLKTFPEVCFFCQIFLVLFVFSKKC